MGRRVWFSKLVRNINKEGVTHEKVSIMAIAALMAGVSSVSRVLADVEPLKMYLTLMRLET